MTAAQTGHVRWTPDPIRQRLAPNNVEDVIKLPIRDITP
jgi:hypothetical protein